MIGCFKSMSMKIVLKSCMTQRHDRNYVLLMEINNLLQNKKISTFLLLRESIFVIFENLLIC